MVRFSANLSPDDHVALERAYERPSYMPGEATRRGECCPELYEIRVQDLAERLQTADRTKVVVGVSGGLDSTQALLGCEHDGGGGASAELHSGLHDAGICDEMPSA
jgi:NAD+ synthase (glutamine-hydrolysing)